MVSVSTYEAVKPALDSAGCVLHHYPIAVGGFQAAADASLGLGVLLDVPVSLSPDGQDIRVDFVVIPCTAPLLLGAPFMDKYGVCLCWDTHQMDVFLEPRSGSASWPADSPRITLPFFIDSWVLSGSSNPSAVATSGQ